MLIRKYINLRRIYLLLTDTEKGEEKEDVALLHECCLSGRDSSLNLLVLVFVSGAVSLSQVDVAFSVLDMGVVDIYWCVISHHHLCFDLFIFRP